MVAFDDVGGVDDSTYRFSILEVSAEIVPLVAPRLDDYWVLFAPLCLQVIKLCLCLLFGLGSIHQSQVGKESFLVLAGHIFHGVAYLMDDAQLHVGMRKYALNSIRKACETVYAGNQNVLYPTVLKICQNA